jgi:hypothetical protein
MTVYTILKEYTWLVNTIHHAGNHTPGQESCDQCKLISDAKVHNKNEIIVNLSKNTQKHHDFEVNEQGE